MEGRASLADLEGGVVCGGLFPEPGDCRCLGAVVVVVTGISLRNLEVSNYNNYIHYMNSKLSVIMVINNNNIE